MNWPKTQVKDNFMKVVRVAGVPLGLLLSIFMMVALANADIESTKRKAEGGDKTAQQILALAYLKGDGIEQNYDQADKWFRKAAGMGSVGIAVVVEMEPRREKRREDGNYPDKSNSMGIFTSAADSGLSDAQYVVGGRYYDGFGVKRDFQEAARWFRLAAEQDHPEALEHLAECYYWGRGVPKDGHLAIEWHTKAAKQGHVPSMFSIIHMYEYGRGVPQDYEKSFMYLTYLAERGDRSAQYVLGHKYHIGRGVPVDMHQAYIWLNLAAGAGRDDAADERGELEESMTLEQILKAQKVCREWKPKRDSL